MPRPLDEVERLRLKYVEMLAMRLDFDAGQRDEKVARERMRKLATAFPGSLRELDDLELGEIRMRIEALEAVLRGKGEIERWMEATMLFHSLARGAICAKRWLGGRKSAEVDEEAKRAFSQAVGSLPFHEDARVWEADLSRVASPPRGRLTNLVFARIAAALDTSESEARRLVFGVSRRERKH